MSASEAVEEDLETLAARLDQTIASISTLDPDVRRAADAALDALGALHRQALVAVVRALRADPRGKELLFALVDDPVIRMVLGMHGLIRADPTTEAQRALDRIRPVLRSHGGDVSLERIADGTAYVRLHGACDGCSMSAVTMRSTVEEALLSALPGLAAVQVASAAPAPSLIPLAAVGVRRPADDLALDGWTEAGTLAALPADRAVPVAGAEAILLLGGANSVLAYRNSCPHLGMPLDDGLVDSAAGTITCAGHGLTYDVVTGECLSLPGGQLEAVPARIVDGAIWIRAGRD